MNARSIPCAAAFLSFSLFALPTISHAKHSFQTIELAADTSINGINASGETIGFVVGGPFVREPDGTVTFYSAEDDCESLGNAINASGTIAGTCTGEDFQIGFIRAKDGTITTFSATEGCRYTSAFGIGNDGTIVGEYRCSSDDIYHAFLRTPDGNVTTIDPPGASGSYAFAINGGEQITGRYILPGSNQWHGYLRSSDGTITSFDVPEGTVGTSPSAINDDGWIVGTYENQDFKTRGFVRDPSGTITNLGVTVPNQINNSEVMSGHSGRKGFFGPPVGKRKRFAIPVTNAVVENAVINDSGLIAGTYHANQAGTRHNYGFIMTK